RRRGQVRQRRAGRPFRAVRRLRAGAGGRAAALRDIKADEAEQVPGYHSIITAKDLEGKYENNVPVAIVLASSQWAADQAARLVVVDYEQTGDPITSVAEAVAKNSVIMQAPDDNVGEDFDQAYDGQACQVEGQLVINEQAHFSIETLTASVAPTEEGLVVTAPHQWVDALAMTLSRILGRPANQIRVVSPRIGGGFGGKLLMIDFGGGCLRRGLGQSRPPLGHQQRGGLHTEHAGHVGDELKHSIDSAFFCPSYRLSLKQMRTDKPESTFVRGPGPAPACLANLLLMDHLAFQLGVDPIEFKYRNLYSDGQIDIVGNTRRGDNFQRMWRELHQAAEVEKRLQKLPSSTRTTGSASEAWTCPPAPTTSSTTAAGPPRSSDGSVTLSHGGAEMGQGIGSKLPRRPRAILEIDINLVKIKATDSHVLPNNEVTGGSSTSEWNCQAAVDAATQIKERLRPIREANPDASWKDLPQGLTGRSQPGCHGIVLLQERRPAREAGTAAPGVGVTEAEVDILTGEFENPPEPTFMMDVASRSTPAVDIGQIEGAFVMGLGYYTMERSAGADIRATCGRAPRNRGAEHEGRSAERHSAWLCTCVTAVKRAIEAFREQTGKPKQFLAFDPPLTPRRCCN
uniref:Ald_Xan_dh_C domain-containing protein n=1 Tax=Macrostomum lignano TaxID=282301 RepID=A0A1I8JNW1_9PLAT